MWFNIIKGKYNFVLQKLIPAFLETINIGDIFYSSDVFDWATEKQDGEYVNVDNDGAPYARGFPIKDQFPPMPAISFSIVEHFKRDISSKRIIAGVGRNFSYKFTRIR